MTRTGIRVIPDRGDIVVGSASVPAARRGGGGRDDRLVAGLLAAPDRIQVVDQFDVEPAPARRGEAPEQTTHIRLDVPRGTAGVLVLANDEATGLWRWHLADGSGQFNVELAPTSAATRGVLGAVAGRVVRFVVVRLADRLIAEAGVRLAAAFENAYRRGGLRWFGPENRLSPLPEERDQLDAGDVARLDRARSLLFLHGTFSQAHSTFARIPPGLFDRLHRRYDGRVWAYDHHTLSRTPRENATDLIARLEELGARDLTVDIIAFDRGGLVARELSERPPNRSPLTVGSVTFVATPNAGTPLCDVDHLQKLVDRVTNLMALIPDNPVTDVIDAVVTVASSVAARAAASLPGLTAMSPTGSYLRDLNARRPAPTADYRAVASDYQPGGDTDLARRLRNLVTDRVISGPNDLIVPTDSVYLGPGDQPLVEERNRVVFTAGAAVDHYGIWERGELDGYFERWFELPPIRRTRELAGAQFGEHTAASSPEAAIEPQTVVVKALHASLECARHHVLVGHFMGAPIEGAEAFLNDRFDNRLRRREQFGQYPEQLGESLIVDTPRPLAGSRPGYPPGAIVVGLDRPGELTREGLTSTVSAAIVRRAVDHLEQRLALPTDQRPAGPLELRFSSVAIASSGVGSLPIDGSVAGVIDAVVAANEQLSRHRDPATGEAAWDHVRIAELEFVEHSQDRAEIIAHAVRRARNLLQSAPESHTLLELTEVLDAGEGALPFLPSAGAATGEWQRVIIRDPRREGGGEIINGVEAGTTVLEFTAIGRSARADRLEVRVDKAAIESLIAESIGSTAPGSQIGNTLYELLLPTAIKNDIVRIPNLQLIVDEHTADIPWEVLTGRVGNDLAPELAIRAGLLRQFRETEGARNQLRTPTGNQVLVIGNPPAGADLPPLAGAMAEADTVTSLLRDRGYMVSALVWDADGLPVVNDLAGSQGSAGRQVLDGIFSRGWRIVHIAAHGHFDPVDSSRSGAVIDETVTISPNVVRQLPVVPELVFLNCCHLGRQADSPLDLSQGHRLAATVSRELMRIGVRAVIAAGWAVDDDAAALFARTLYDRLLDGALLGASVHAARKRVREVFPDSMTWAAFQCYGDPGYALEPPPGRALARPAIVSSDELVRHVGTIRALAAKVGLPSFHDITARQSELVDQLDHYRDELVRRGWESATTLFDLGIAFAELGRYTEALTCLRRAWADDRSNEAPVRMLEQLGNFEIRLAQRRFLESGSMSATDTVDGETVSVADLVRASEEHLTLAHALGANGERLALLGSFHRKTATMAKGARRKRAVIRACESYRKAHDWQVRRTARDGVAVLNPYYTLNWLQMAVLAGSAVPDSVVRPLLTAIDRNPAQPTVRVDENFAVRGRTRTPVLAAAEPEDFWSRITHANLDLTRRLLSGRLDAAALIAVYDAALRSGRSSQRNRDSTIDHLRDLAELLDNDELRTTVDDLRRWTGGTGGTGVTEAKAAEVAEPELAVVPAQPLVTAAPPVAVPARPSSEPRLGTTFAVDVLPAGHGDCLVVTYGDPPRRILIDGGTAPAYKRGLAPYLDAAGGSRFDLFVITHVDSDHIDGAVVLLQELERRQVELGEVWFNGWRQIAPGRGPVQGEFVGALLPRRQWNRRFRGRAVVLPDGPLTALELPGGARLTLVSPEPSSLEGLRRDWHTAVAQAGFVPGDEQASLALLEKRKALRPGVRGEGGYGNDNSVANESSIAFLLEHGGRSALFTGDAHAAVLRRGLDRLRRERNVDRVAIDVIKLPHHGSKQNVDPELFDLVDCRRYVVSTNGDYFKHPSPETLELLARGVGECELLFNHDNDVVRRWESVLEPGLKNKIEATYAPKGEHLRVEI